MRKGLDLEGISLWANMIALLGWSAHLVSRQLFGPRFHYAPFTIACGACSLCLVAIAALTILQRGRESRQPIELAALESLQRAPLWAWLAISAGAMDIHSCGAILAFTVPGVNAVCFFLGVIHFVPYITSPDLGAWRRFVQQAAFVLLFLMAATELYMIAHKLVVGVVSPFAAWPVAALEASILTPVILSIVRATSEWVRPKPPESARQTSSG